MTLSLSTIELPAGLTGTLIRTLNRNAAEAICQCFTYLAYNPLTGKLVHVDGCLFCYDPRTGDRDPVCVDVKHHCATVRPVVCDHQWPHDNPARLYADCLDGKANCCNCCQPPDYDPNDL